MIRTVTLAAVGRLLERGIKALVVACNTATSAAIETIRAEVSLPVIGVEPAVKPAVLMRSRGKVLVLATAATLRQQKLHTLVEHLGNPEYLVPFACPGLVELVERGVTNGPELEKFLFALFAPLRGLDVQVVVLGCTHYVFARHTIERSFTPQPLVVDGNQGTAANLVRVLAGRDLLCHTGEDHRGAVEFVTTGERDVRTDLPAADGRAILMLSSGIVRSDARQRSKYALAIFHTCSRLAQIPGQWPQWRPCPTFALPSGTRHCLRVECALDKDREDGL